MTFAHFAIWCCLAFAGWCIGHYVYDRWIKPLKRRTIHVADAGLAAHFPKRGLPTFSDANHRRICAILDDAGFEYTVTTSPPLPISTTTTWKSRCGSSATRNAWRC